VTDQAGLPTPKELEARAAELFRQWRVLDTEVEVLWNNRLSTTAGRAFVKSGLIELNPSLLAKSLDEVDGVLIHEAAHVAAYRLFGANIPAHGRHWRALMRHAGEEPEVTHSMPVDDVRSSRSRAARYLYLRMCGSCGDRALLEQVRYGRCSSCSDRDSYLVVKTKATAAGRRALLRMSDADVRAHFA
jgi:predicted SprT family Zn-dependent metalloprotease